MVRAGLFIDDDEDEVVKPVFYLRGVVTPSPSLLRATANGDRSNTNNNKMLPNDRTTDTGFAIAIATFSLMPGLWVLYHGSAEPPDPLPKDISPKHFSNMMIMVGNLREPTITIKKAAVDLNIDDDDDDDDDEDNDQPLFITTARFEYSSDRHWFEISASTPEEVVRLNSFVCVVKSTMAAASQRKFKVPSLKKLFKLMRRDSASTASTADDNNSENNNGFSKTIANVRSPALAEVRQDSSSQFKRMAETAGFGSGNDKSTTPKRYSSARKSIQFTSLSPTNTLSRTKKRSDTYNTAEADPFANSHMASSRTRKNKNNYNYRQPSDFSFSDPFPEQSFPHRQSYRSDNSNNSQLKDVGFSSVNNAQHFTAAAMTNDDNNNYSSPVHPKSHMRGANSYFSKGSVGRSKGNNESIDRRHQPRKLYADFKNSNSSSPSSRGNASSPSRVSVHNRKRQTALHETDTLALTLVGQSRNVLMSGRGEFPGSGAAGSAVREGRSIDKQKLFLNNKYVSTNNGGGGQQQRSGKGGLRNLGNTCYMNAVLQALTSLGAFTRTISAIANSAGLLTNKYNSKQSTSTSPVVYMLDDDDGDNGENKGDTHNAAKQPKNKVEPEVLRALAQLLGRGESSESGYSSGSGTVRRNLGRSNSFSSSDPSAVKEAIEKHVKAFEGNRQEDAHEFLCSVLDRLDQELEALPKDGKTAKRNSKSSVVKPKPQVSATTSAASHKSTTSRFFQLPPLSPSPEQHTSSSLSATVDVTDTSSPSLSNPSEATAAATAAAKATAKAAAGAVASPDKKEFSVVDDFFTATVQCMLTCNGDACGYTRLRNEDFRGFSVDLPNNNNNSNSNASTVSLSPGSTQSNTPTAKGNSQFSGNGALFNSPTGATTTAKASRLPVSSPSSFSSQASPIPPTPADIHTLLRSYFADEQLDYKCEQCQCKTATMSYKLIRLPRVLLLHVKRFEVHFSNGGMGTFATTPSATFNRPVMVKRHEAVAGPLSLDVGEFVVSDSASHAHDLTGDDKNEFELSGVVNHLGYSATSGHYTTCSREQQATPKPKSAVDIDVDAAVALAMLGGSQWKEFDDSKVKVVSEYDAVKSLQAQKNAYIYVYVGKNDLAN